MDNQKIILPDLDQAQQRLGDLLEAVTRRESELAGGEAQRLTRGKTAVQRLKETTVKFGNPQSRLIPLTIGGLQAKGMELNYEIEQLINRYDFYSMVVTVDFYPQPSVVISRLVCQLDFGPKGQNEPIVHLMSPNSRYQTVVGADISLTMGLDANLDVAGGVDTSELARLPTLPDYNQFTANVSTKDELKALITLDCLNYDWGQFTLFSNGENNSECYWRFEGPEIQAQSAVRFDVVFKVPKGRKSMDLIGTVWIEPSIDWLHGELTDIWQDLPSYIRDLFGSQDRAARSFAVGTKEKWLNLGLPQA